MHYESRIVLPEHYVHVVSMLLLHCALPIALQSLQHCMLCILRIVNCKRECGWGPQEMHGELGVNCLWDNLLVLIIMYGGEIW